MKCLLDTHTLIWALGNDSRLDNEVKQMILDEKNQIYVSVASIWEIQLKNQFSKGFGFTADDVVRACQRSGYIFLNICVESILNMSSLKVKDGEYVNKDPFDRLLVSQAKTNGMVLLTHDNVLQHYNESFIKIF